MNNRTYYFQKNWEEIKLGDIIEVEHGWPFKSNFMDGKLNYGPIVVAIGNFNYTGGFRFEDTAIKRYTGDYPQEYILSSGDLVVVMTCQTPDGEILGIPGSIPDDGVTYLHNQRIGKIVIKNKTKICKDFLYYLFISKDFNRELFATSTGTKILHTAPDRIKSYTFSLPPLSEQKAIASILGALDDKIELNNQMNQTLETMARALYKSWFVDFDPVVAKAAGRKPYGMDEETAALFPDRFVDSELGPIPEGWEASNLGSVITLHDHKRVPLSKQQRLEKKGDFRYYGAAGILDYVDDYIFDGRYLLLGEDGTVITENGQAVTQYVWGKFWVNNHAHVIEGCGNISIEIMLLHMSQIDILPYVTGAVQPKINQKNLKTIPFIKAPHQVIDIFNEKIQPYFSLYRSNHDESKTLGQLRDLLLPKLISGEIRIKDAEEVVEEAV